jgi:hypothetical protein
MELMSSGKVVAGPMVTRESFIGFGQMQQALTDLMRPSEQIQVVLAP